MRGRRTTSTAAEAPGWQGARPFIGRDEVIARLEVDLASALDGSGHVIVLHGPPGSGRDALVRRFAEEARRRHRRLRIGLADAADPERPAWAQLAFSFTARQRAGAALLRSATEWLFIVPIIGDVLTAIADTIRALRKKKKDEKPKALGTGSSVDQVRMLLSVGGTDPRLIILENLEASDPSELAGAFAMVQRIRETRTLFVATASSAGGRLPQAVADLLHEAERLKCGRAVEIPALTPAQCVEAMAGATGSPLPDGWQAWLDINTPLTPRELWRLMDEAVAMKELRREGSRWAWSHAPAEAFRAPARMEEGAGEAVAPADRALLAAAGRLGARFEAPALGRVLDLDEVALADRLAPLARRGILALDGTVERDGEFIDVYRFVRPADAQRWAESTHADAPREL